MSSYLLIYLGLSVATALASVRDGSQTDLIASAILGLLWPIYLPARLIRRLIG
jgi:hypothetical protein